MIVVGDYVKLYDYQFDEVVIYKIMPSYEELRFVDMRSRTKNNTRSMMVSEANGNDSISEKSPLGKAVLGHKIGQMVNFSVNGGVEQQYLIIGVSRNGEYWNEIDVSPKYVKAEESRDAHNCRQGKAKPNVEKNNKFITFSEKYRNEDMYYGVFREVVITLKKVKTGHSSIGKYEILDIISGKKLVSDNENYHFDWKNTQIFLIRSALKHFNKTCKLTIMVEDAECIHALMDDKFSENQARYGLPDVVLNCILEVDSMLVDYIYRFKELT